MTKRPPIRRTVYIERGDRVALAVDENGEAYWMHCPIADVPDGHKVEGYFIAEKLARPTIALVNKHVPA